MIAGRGAPAVSQCKMTDIPSITVLSNGPAVMFGAIPERTHTHTYTDVKFVSSSGVSNQSKRENKENRHFRGKVGKRQPEANKNKKQKHFVCHCLCVSVCTSL